MSNQSNIETLKLLERIHKEKHPEYFDLLLQIYERHGKTSPKDCLDEIRLDGSNTFASIFRGRKGVDYDEIVADVARKIKVEDTNITDDYLENELKILGKITDDYWNGLSQEEQEKKAEQLKKLSNKYFDPADLLNGLKLSGNIVPIVIKTFGLRSTQKMMLQIMPEIIGAAIGMQGLRTILGTFIPIINILMNGWLLYDIAGPAFRKTIPTVATIALLRLQTTQEI